MAFVGAVRRLVDEAGAGGTAADAVGVLVDEGVGQLENEVGDGNGFGWDGHERPPSGNGSTDTQVPCAKMVDGTNAPEAEMVKTQVHLTEQQASALKARAVAEGLSMAELVRRSVDAFLRTRAPLSHEEKKRRALDAVGQFRSGVGDLSVHHDRYLAEAFGE